MADAEQHDAKVLRNRRRNILRRSLLALGPIVAVAAGLYVYATTGRYVSTQNAYVRGGQVAVTSNVSGQIVAVHVRVNESVDEGRLLFVIDPEPFEIALREAEAVLAEARLQIEAKRAELSRKRAELKSAEEDAAYQKTEFDRHARLVETNTVSRSRYDEVRHNYTEARSRLITIQQDIAQSIAELGGDANIDTEAHPKVMKAISARDRAALDLRNTQVRAMTGGIVARIGLQPGEYVQAGAPIFAMMAAGSLWVEANLKETELTHIKQGQSATLVVDTFPEVEFRAKVSGISPAAGSEYSVLPAQNATGNWVKITQRVPVRLEIVPADNHPPLRAGMSVEVSIDTERKRGWPFGGAAAKR